MERFEVSDLMKRPVGKDDKEKIDALDLIRTKNKGFE